MPIASTPLTEAGPQPPYTWVDEIEFIMAVEDRWHLTIPDDDAVACYSLKQFSEYVAGSLLASGGIASVAEIQAEIVAFASRHFAPVTITPEFDPVCILREDVAKSRAMAPYFQKLERKRSLNAWVKKAGRGVVIFFACAAYCALFCTGVRLIVEQDSRLVSTGCIIFVLSLHLPIIVGLMVSARKRGKHGSTRQRQFG